MCSILYPGNPIMGGMKMQSQNYWELFLETGAPEIYLLYHHAKRLEEDHVSDNSGTGAAGFKLQ